MNWLDFIASVVDSTVLPLTLSIIIFYFRKSIIRLISKITEVKYKDGQIRFETDVNRLSRTVPEQERTDYQAEIDNISNTKDAILDAWAKVEATADKKYRQLLHSDLLEEYKPKFAIPYLELSGVLIPSSLSTLRYLHDLYFDAVHLGDNNISLRAAKEYVVAALSICEKIEAIESVPDVDLSVLTLLILQLNKLVDKKKYDDITIDEICDQIEAGTVLRFISDRAKGDVDLSVQFQAKTTDQPFESFYVRYLQAIQGGYGDGGRKWGVRNSGLCLLIAWTNEIIQQGSGWHPTRDVAGLHDDD